MVSLSKDDILQRLKYHKILDSTGKVINETKFQQLIKAVFLGWISLERIKSFWKKEALEESIFQDKIERVRPYYHRPFHYVGFSKKTLFISEKEVHERIFFHEFIPQFISRIEDISLIRRTCNLISKINDNLIRNHPACQATTDGFCDGCRDKFAEELLNNHVDFLTPLQIKSYSIIDLSIETIMAFIDEDDLIIELEESVCEQCKRLVLEHFKFCPECGKKLTNKNSSSSINREKVLNNLIAVYLEKKTGIMCEANQYYCASKVEIDIIATKGNRKLAIEGTSIVDLDVNYLYKKVTSLLFLDVKFNTFKNKMILWSMDFEGNKKANLDFIDEVAKGSFEILKASLPRKIMINQSISITQQDLNLIIKEADYIVQELLTKISEL